MKTLHKIKFEKQVKNYDTLRLHRANNQPIENALAVFFYNKHAKVGMFVETIFTQKGIVINNRI